MHTVHRQRHRYSACQVLRLEDRQQQHVCVLLHVSHTWLHAYLS